MSCSHYEERVEKVELPQLKVNGVAIGEPAGPRTAIPPGGQLRAGAGGRLPCADRPPVAPATGRRAGHRGPLRRRRDAGGSAHPPIAGGRGAGPGSRRRRLPDLVRGQSGTPARPLAPAIAPCAAGLRAGRPGRPRDGAQAGRGAARRVARASRALRRPGPAFLRLSVEGGGRRPRLDRAGADRPRIREAPAAPRARAAGASAGKPLWPACGGTAGARGRRAARLRRGPRANRRAPASASVAAGRGQYIGVLAGDACIEGFAFEGADGALVQ